MSKKKRYPGNEQAGSSAHTIEALELVVDMVFSNTENNLVHINA